MLLPIDVRIEVGEFVRGYSFPYKDGVTGQIQIDFVGSKVESINKNKGLVKVEKYAEPLAIHRIEEFSFGGIFLDNPKFDDTRMWEENRKFHGI